MTTLLQELLEAKKRKKRRKNRSTCAPVIQNPVAKHSRSKTGAGAHENKTGENASRTRRNRQWLSLIHISEPTRPY